MTAVLVALSPLPPEDVAALVARLTPVQRSILAQVAGHGGTCSVLRFAVQDLGILAGLLLVGVVMRPCNDQGEPDRQGVTLTAAGAAVVGMFIDEVFG